MRLLFESAATWFFEGRSCASHAVALLVITAFAVSPTRADTSGGTTVCLGPYALCSSAECTPVAGEPDKVTCHCEVPPPGLNIGGASTCQDRARQLTSTFSLYDFSGTDDRVRKRSAICEGPDAGAWAFCLDAPCTETGTDQTGARQADCTCTLKPASTYYTFTDACPATDTDRAAFCGKIWSAARLDELLSGYGALWPFHAEIPRLEYCPR